MQSVVQIYENALNLISHDSWFHFHLCVWRWRPKLMQNQQRLWQTESQPYGRRGRSLPTFTTRRHLKHSQVKKSAQCFPVLFFHMKDDPCVCLTHGGQEAQHIYMEADCNQPAHFKIRAYLVFRMQLVCKEMCNEFPSHDVFLLHVCHKKQS